MVCYYFGTFNPVHNAHLKIADEVKKLCAAESFERVVFVPAFSPPHKDVEIAPAQHRLNMLKLAAGEENVSDIEYHLEPPSYTYKTIEKLGKCDFIIGFDAFKEIESWKNPEYLKEMLNFIVIPRRTGLTDETFDNLKQKGYRFKILNLDFIDISSENIRRLIKAGESIKGLVPCAVEEYIYEHRLYR